LLDRLADGGAEHARHGIGSEDDGHA
jgi:hypothetical protein